MVTLSDKFLKSEYNDFVSPVNAIYDSIINKTLYNKFVEYTVELDNIRNQTFNQTFGICL